MADAPKICGTCKKSIEGGKAVAAMGGHFHPDHFTCESCKSPLIGKQFVDVEGKPYCTDCHANKICPKCKACGKPITTKATIALDAKWHQFCFKCKKCGKPMMLDQQFKVDDGLPKCLTC
ncbi:transforming growth factor beta-1-induced transcript 1 protein-like isoform X5 [Harmonia axyridis]|uniref:transforming growth factor beta-1-induced transcript 1 protein-like isoform X5 n=1 Tax=Harmonia axyridis TaxID=115357 RepID=UPI001E276329|nr:transforming growth factor beta-1-induced transcript 1 protein-like isoform X5 [Harmonia axyridis]